MAMYNIVQYIKDWAGINAGAQIPNFDQPKDAQVLRLLSSDIAFRSSRSGKKYLYYVIQSMADRDLIRFVLRRNGLTPEFHNSKYFFSPRVTPVFRIPAEKIKNNADANMFINSVIYAPRSELQHKLYADYIEQLRMSMGGKIK